ncbi:MAG: YesL family protein [Parasporobacterium sp.]|nr:YesL family protein [Parasporobacterium sp.]
MNRLVAGFLNNESFFGRLMTKIAIVVGANLMFLVFCIPVVTIGPSLAALYYVMMETLYRNHALNPFKTFWKGFKMNLKQGILTWLIFLAIAVLAYFDIRFSSWAGGIFSVFLVGIYIVLAAAIILYSYLYPVMAAFNGKIRDLFANSIYFAFKKPLRMILLVGVEAGAAFLTYGFLEMLPLWAFCWFFFGFGAIAMLGAKLLLPLFKPFQEQQSSGQTKEMEPRLSDDDEDSLEDLEKLDL